MNKLHFFQVREPSSKITSTLNLSKTCIYSKTGQMEFIATYCLLYLVKKVVSF